MSVRVWSRVLLVAWCGGLTCVGAVHAQEGNSDAAKEGAPSDDADPPADVPGDQDEADAAEDGKDGEPDPGAEDEKPEPIVSLKSNREFQVVARSLKLKESSAERLREVAQLYRKATGKKLVVTGGDRTAERQAQLMLKKLKTGEDLIKLYSRTDLVKAILDAYKAAQASGSTRRGTLIRMRKVIEQQMAEGQYVSRHLNFTAADVRSRGLSSERVAALREAVKAVPGVSMVDERDGAAPCFHLGL